MMHIPGENLVSKFRPISFLTERNVPVTGYRKWSTEKSHQEEERAEADLLCSENSSFRTPSFHRPLSRPCTYFYGSNLVFFFLKRAPPPI